MTHTLKSQLLFWPFSRPSRLKCHLLKLYVLSILWTLGCAGTFAAEQQSPNIVIFFIDDGGYADFRPFGSPPYPTPNVERLASEGTVFTRLYVPQAVCSASRAALLSGCWPGRTKVFGAHPPGALGLDPRFKIISEILKERGYRTAVFGKWHIGDQTETRPPARGFDESAGLMYSNDMWRFHPTAGKRYEKWPLHFWENGHVKIEDVSPEDQKYLTYWYTDYAVRFIRRWAGKQPFFLYVPHSMVHVPLYCRDEFRGRSGAGLYGDVVMELDWSLGEIVSALRESGVIDETIIIWIGSDNGPWLVYGNHAGKTPFREGKGTSFEGGVRTPCIIRYPKAFRAGAVSARPFSTVDILPTLAHVVGAHLPNDMPLDGKDVWDWITGQEHALDPHEYYPISTGSQFEAIISGDGRWKLHLPHPYRTVEVPGQDGNPGKYSTKNIGWTLYDLIEDPFERFDVKEKAPVVFQRLRSIALQHLQRFYPQQSLKWPVSD